MSMKKCPECENEVEQNVTICPNCGYQFKEDVKTGQQEQTIETSEIPETPENQSTPDGTAKQQPRNPFKTMRRCMIAGMIVFALISAIFFGRAHNARTVYYNSSSSSYSRNAYVGGDAYNFIINGTYFTGFSVTATGCMVCAVILGMGAATIKPKSEGSKEDEDK